METDGPLADQDACQTPFPDLNPYRFNVYTQEPGDVTGRQKGFDGHLTGNPLRVSDTISAPTASHSTLNPRCAQ